MFVQLFTCFSMSNCGHLFSKFTLNIRESYPGSLCEPSHMVNVPISTGTSSKGVHIVNSSLVPRPMYTLSTCAPVKPSWYTPLRNKTKTQNLHKILKGKGEFHLWIVQTNDKINKTCLGTFSIEYLVHLLFFCDSPKHVIALGSDLYFHWFYRII